MNIKRMLFKQGLYTLNSAPKAIQLSGQ
ncbi:hypothetical protein Sf25_gp199 [Shigella phage Sf25]|uniref:Uncharacterized protein n=1 Tax=Shigella phage Sf25 TaxID=2024310 RepID=A0A2K9VME3_9CAUD|nr:hypothetical protein Sf25_gp199 [Shigella phage Sf25]